MKKSFTILLPMSFVLLIACGPADQTQLLSKLDSLENEVKNAQELARTLGEVGVLMDSIDANRQALRINMVEGSTYDDYIGRMQGLNNYVRDTEKKIAELERLLKKSKATAGAYSVTIKKLKNELEEKNRRIEQLQSTVEQYRNENQNLMRVAEMQELELDDKDAQIDAKRLELEAIEKRIQEVLAGSQVTEAEGYFARALAVEETANRTKLAPKKRKASLEEALALYKKALSLGHPKAKEQVARLENQLKK